MSLNYTALTRSVALVLPALAMLAAAGAEPEEKTPQEDASSVASAMDVEKLPEYKPPLRGAPSPTRLVGGASRGKSANTLMLAPLAPDHVGLTTNDQPVLYWYLSKAIPTQLMVTVIDENGIRPVAEINLDAPDKADVQRLKLADHGIYLEPGADYEWSIALIPDTHHRSKDIVAKGAIRYIEPPGSLVAKLQSTGKKSATYIYAAEGIWYDAIHAISELIDANPKDGELRAQRAALLEQVGLTEIAAWDRGPGTRD